MVTLPAPLLFVAYKLTEVLTRRLLTLTQLFDFEALGLYSLQSGRLKKCSGWFRTLLEASLAVSVRRRTVHIVGDSHVSHFWVAALRFGCRWCTKTLVAASGWGLAKQNSSTGAREHLLGYINNTCVRGDTLVLSFGENDTGFVIPVKCGERETSRISTLVHVAVQRYVDFITEVISPVCEDKKINLVVCTPFPPCVRSGVKYNYEGRNVDAILRLTLEERLEIHNAYTSELVSRCQEKYHTVVNMNTVLFLDSDVDLKRHANYYRRYSASDPGDNHFDHVEIGRVLSASSVLDLALAGA